MQTTQIKVNKIWNILLPLAVSGIIALQAWQIRSTYAIKTEIAVMGEKVGGIEALKERVDTALAVLTQHGAEFANVDAEQLRLRTVYDELNKTLADRTSDRFTGSDAAELRQWIRDEFAQHQQITDLKYEALKREVQQARP